MILPNFWSSKSSEFTIILLVFCFWSSVLPCWFLVILDQNIWKEYSGWILLSQYILIFLFAWIVSDTRTKQINSYLQELRE